MEKKNIERRKFLKLFGSSVVASSALLSSCKTNNKDNEEIQDTAAVEPPKGKMTYRVNPKTGDKVSLLGYGMMRLPLVGKEKPDDKDNDAPIDQKEVNRLVDYAIQHGVNLFDTSPAYCKGNSEAATGIALHRYPRNKYFVSTKLSNFAEETWTRKASMEMFENSLKNLQVDYVDYLLLHAIGMGEDAMESFNARYMDNGILDWLVEQQKKGRIKNLGFSYHGDIDVFDMLLQWHDEGKYHFDFVLIELNYLDWNYAKDINARNTNASYLYGELEKRNIPAFVMEPLLGGRLAKVPHPIALKLKRKEPEKSIASWAFRYAGSYKGILTVLSGMTYMDHLKDNLRSYCPLKPLDNKEMEYLHNDIAKEMLAYETIPCNDCKYCMPCPYGLDIPGIFVHYNKVKTEGKMPVEADKTATDDYKAYQENRRRFLIGYDRSVPKLRQADKCVGCGECMSHCPQRIKIPEELQKIDKFVEKLKQSME